MALMSNVQLPLTSLGYVAMHDAFDDQSTKMTDRDHSRFVSCYCTVYCSFIPRATNENRSVIQEPFRKE